MRSSRAVLAILCVAGLAACSNPDRFGAGGAGGAGGMGPGGMAAPGGADGGPLDPASTAYFDQTIGDRVVFMVDQSTLTDAARETLRQQAQWLARNPEYTAIIEGHADEQGTREYNLALGARRAASARDFLVAQGVATGRLRTVTYGKERPIEICSTESCYAKNRRAVTVLAAGGLTS
jgi:peptidoglycan-associated lipoprotein